MTKRDRKIYLEIQSPNKKPVGLLRTSFYEKGVTKHTQHGRITGKTVQELKLLQLALRGDVMPLNGGEESFEILSSKEYGASAAIHQTITKIGLDKAISWQDYTWKNCVIAMITGRVLFAGSKLHLSKQAKNTCLWETCGIEENINVEKHCYLPMDELLKRQERIQTKLAKKHLVGGKLILYDITSSYLEGKYSKSELVSFGYNRDGKKGHEQIVIGLVCTSEGCPVAVEVFPGNTKDSTTVKGIINTTKKRYQISEAIMIGDRGMLTKQNLDYIRDTHQDMKFITALTRDSMKTLLREGIIQMGLFDSKNIAEVSDPNNPGQRYCLCKNEYKAAQDCQTLEAMIKKTEKALQEIVEYKQSTTPEILGSRVGKALEKNKTSKYFRWHIVADKDANRSRKHKVVFSIETKTLEQTKQLAGCYVITSNTTKEEMRAEEVVRNYKNLIQVENAFKSLKSVSLEMRPMYHKKDERIKAHVFLCMLAYYVQWHIKESLESLISEEEKHGKNKEWTLRHSLENLRQITKNRVRFKGVEFLKNTTPSSSQKKILKLLGVKI